MGRREDGRALLSRAEVVRRLRHLGATIPKLRDWESRKGWIRRAAREKGRVLYPLEEVVALERQLAEQRQSSPGRLAQRGELARRAFAAFLAGRSVAEVVVDLGVAPELVYELHALYSPGDLVVTGALRRELDELADELGYAVPGPVELVALVRTLVEHVRRCELARIRR